MTCFCAAPPLPAFSTACSHAKPAVPLPALRVRPSARICKSVGADIFVWASCAARLYYHHLYATGRREHDDGAPWLALAERWRCAGRPLRAYGARRIASFSALSRIELHCLCMGI